MPVPTWGQGHTKACVNDVAVSEAVTKAAMSEKYFYSGKLAARYDKHQGKATASPQPRHGEMIKLQRTGVDKILAIRFWGGVGGANIKNMTIVHPTRPPNTTYYGVLMYCIVLKRPTGDNDSLRQGLVTSRRAS